MLSNETNDSSLLGQIGRSNIANLRYTANRLQSSGHKQCLRFLNNVAAALNKHKLVSMVINPPILISCKRSSSLSSFSSSLNFPSFNCFIFLAAARLRAVTKYISHLVNDSVFVLIQSMILYFVLIQSMILYFVLI